MCGIVGGLFHGDAPQELGACIDLLKQLEYRGYDSVGVAWLDEANKLKMHKALGDTSQLPETLFGETTTATIGHTRWATHGSVSVKNAHPHVSACGRVALVHNGIIENHEELASRLELEHGIRMQTQTDTEVLANWIARTCFQPTGNVGGEKSICDSLRECVATLEGTFAFVAMFPKDEPGSLFGAKRGSPLAFAQTGHGLYFCSDAACFLAHNDETARATEAVFLDEDEIVMLSLDVGIEHISAPMGNKVDRLPTTIATDDFVFRDGSTTKMEQEISQQPAAVEKCMLSRLDANGKVHLGGMHQKPFDSAFRNARRVLFVGCGTSLHAAMISARAFELLVGVPCIAINATEAEEGHVFSQGDVLVACSQSGETMDVIRILKKWKTMGAPTFGICNGINSTIFRDTDAGIYMRAGRELAVASTKTFATQVLCGVLLAVANAPDVPRRLVADMLSLSAHMKAALESCRPQMESLAQNLRFCNTMFIAGRGMMVYSAMESALKIKEIARIHAEGVSAAEFKHGPFALLGPETVVLFISHSDDELKAKASASEIMSRGAMLVEIGDKRMFDDSFMFVHIPSVHPFLFSILSTIPAQLLALRIAEIRGYNADRPRNLAKCVTVA